MSASKPTLILKPAPQSSERIFSPVSRARLGDLFEVIDLEQDDSTAAFDDALPHAFAIVGQPDLPTEALRRAASLKALINVEGNFFPNVDYPTAFRQGVRVLGCGTAYAQAVAEYALGLALDLARGITREDRAFRRGEEGWDSASNIDAVLLRRAKVGLIGFGNLGKHLHQLLQPFNAEIRVFDPWLPTSILLDAGVIPSTLDDVLTESRFVFVLATVTAESQHLLNAAKLDLLQKDARLMVISRAAVVDFDALLERLRAGAFLASIDVWPVEPLPPDSAFRELENLVMSSHRAGGIPSAFLSIGEMVCDDLELMLQGLPPARLQTAAPELVGRYRSRPVG
ncbi:NAD(P)-dependent oxidoreductase [uncultured Amnibacterium sp.]|uniref:NAD(P)-dependent oxidoreductase n=1 Tax=uncultured Amnibacterium sp. TaxID=1631851 RepID=UPI0035CAFEAE